MVPLQSRKSLQNAVDLLEAIPRIFLAHEDWSNMQTEEKQRLRVQANYKLSINVEAESV